jgi:hypothetical protein
MGAYRIHAFRTLREEKMKTTRLPKLIITVSLLIAAFLAFDAIQKTAAMPVNNPPSSSSGIGDLRRFESQQGSNGNSNSIPVTGLENFRSSAAQQLNPVALDPSLPIGIGNLRLLEYQQSENSDQSSGYNTLRLDLK